MTVQSFGSGAKVEVEIGGLNAGSDHDSIVFEGTDPLLALGLLLAWRRRWGHYKQEFLSTC